MCKNRPRSGFISHLTSCIMQHYFPSAQRAVSQAAHKMAAMHCLYPAAMLSVEINTSQQRYTVKATKPGAMNIKNSHSNYFRIEIL